MSFSLCLILCFAPRCACKVTIHGIKEILFPSWLSYYYQRLMHRPRGELHYVIKVVVHTFKCRFKVHGASKILGQTYRHPWVAASSDFKSIWISFTFIRIATHMQDFLIVRFHVVQLVPEVTYGGVLLLFHLLTLSFFLPQFLLAHG